MIVPTVIFVPSVLHDQVIEAESYVETTYGKKANPVSITPYNHITPTETVLILREALKTSRFIFCSWSVLSNMETTNRKIFIMDLATDCLVVEIKEHQRVRFAGRKESVPRALIQKLKELYEVPSKPILEKTTVSRDYDNVWVKLEETQKTDISSSPSDIVELIPPKVEKPITIIIKDSLKAKLAKL